MAMAMTTVELACVAVLVLYALAHAREPGWLRDVGLLAVAGWIGEETCIRAYGFYQYAPGWHARLLDVPVMIALIWPAVVLSARATARQLVPDSVPAIRRAAWVGLVTGALVVFDASLIEPIAVRAGLWDWNEPGLFGVPPVGILGWGFFAAPACWVLERFRDARRALVLGIAPLATHALLLAAWWLCLRWVLRGTLHPVVGVGAIALAGSVFVAAVRARRAGLSRGELVSRAAATGFFAVLLARAADPWLVAYALAFTPPHLLLCARRPAAVGEGEGEGVSEVSGEGAGVTPRRPSAARPPAGR